MTCHGKIPYADKKTAKKAARRVETRGVGCKVGHMDVYRCGDHWHIGHAPDSWRTRQAS